MNEVTPLPAEFQRASGMTRRTMLKGAVISGVAAAVGDLGLTRSAAAATATAATAAAGATGVVREYWLQAEAFERNLIPTTKDNLQGRIWDASDCTYWAIGYRAYTANWQHPLASGAAIGENAGIPGPIIRGNVGDRIVIHFRNNDTHYGFPHSIHVHGLLYTPENDGAWMSYNANAPGTAVRPGETYTYRYTVLPTSVGSWVYHDHSPPQSLTGGAPVMDIGTQLGLFGLIAIDDPKAPSVDREMFLFLHQLYASDVPSLAQDFACFNGYAFAPNTPVFSAELGQKVRWRIGALGQEFYVFHLHGHCWLDNGFHTDTAVVGPATTATFEYEEDNRGHWHYHCQSPNHIASGMTGEYIVK